MVGLKGFNPPQGVYYEALIQVISPEVASFTADWLTVQVTRDRFAASSSDPSQFEMLRDFVLGAFGLLEHTPLSKMGINRDMHYRMESVEEWHAVGHLLAPKEVWRKSMQDPGLENLTIIGRRPGSTAKIFRVTVQPSTRMPKGAVGVYIATNEHFENEEGDASQRLLTVLRDHWRDATEYAKTVAEGILTHEGLRG